jgi:hypothetical protein
MMNWNDLRVEQEIAQERYQRLIRDKEIDRLIGQAQPGTTTARALLVRFGQQLERWGQRLQSRGTWNQPDVVCCS